MRSDDKPDIIKMLREADAFLEGHFQLSSGLHSSTYLQCALLLSHPAYAEALSKELAGRFKDDKIDLVVGPAYGGIIVAHELARALGARAVFTERRDGSMQLRRNFGIKKGQRVLVCEDVVTTGRSTKEVIEVIKPYMADIVGVAALIDRSGGILLFGNMRFEGLKKIMIDTYEPSDCPLCKGNIPITKPGSRGRI